MLHNDLYNYLSTEPEIADLFPGGVHHVSIPQDVSVWPALSFVLVGHQEVSEDLDSPDPRAVDQHTYQFDIISDSSESAIVAADSFIQTFRKFRGTMLTSRIQWVTLSNVSHLDERRGDKLRRRVSADFQIVVDT